MSELGQHLGNANGTPTEADVDSHFKESVSKLVEANKKKGIYELFPLDLMSTGLVPWDAPAMGMMIRRVRADHYRDDPTLKPEEKLLLEIAAKEDPKATWAELWLKATDRDDDVPLLHTNNRFHQQVVDEVAEPLSRIGDIYCFAWEYGDDFFPKFWPEENRWWTEFMTGWGLTENPLGYARKFAPEQPCPPLEDVVDRKVAKSFKELCKATHELLAGMDLGKWKTKPLSETRYRNLARSIQVEYKVAGTYGVMLAFGGIPTKAHTYSFDLLKNSEDRWASFSAPVRLDDILLSGPNPRARVVVSDTITGEEFNSMASQLQLRRAEGKFQNLHIKLTYASWKTKIDSIPIGENDLDPEIWGEKELIGAAKVVSEESIEKPSTNTPN